MLSEVIHIGVRFKKMRYKSTTYYLSTLPAYRVILLDRLYKHLIKINWNSILYYYSVPIKHDLFCWFLILLMKLCNVKVAATYSRYILFVIISHF